MHNQMFGGVKGNQKGIETTAQEVRGFEQCNYPLWKNYAPTKRALYIRQA